MSEPVRMNPPERRKAVAAEVRPAKAPNTKERGSGLPDLHVVARPPRGKHASGDPGRYRKGCGRAARR